MNQNPLSKEFLINLVKKDELRETGHRPVFSKDELTLIKEVITLGKKSFKMRDRDYIVRYFTWKKKAWVTVRPTVGFVAMFSAPYSDVMKAESI